MAEIATKIIEVFIDWLRQIETEALKAIIEPR
jgi:hypothetical protein